MQVAFVHVGLAADYTVGGAAGFWDIPSVSKINYTMWALWNSYFVGDSLYFRYQKGDHSVLEVTFKDYQYCRNARPIAIYEEGNSRVFLDKYGPYYFICGTPDHCYLGQKFKIDVSDYQREYSPPAIDPPSSISSSRDDPPIQVPSMAPLHNSFAPKPTSSSAPLSLKSPLGRLLIILTILGFFQLACLG